MMMNVAALALVMMTGGTGVHPFHVTIAEVDVNAEAGTLEVAIRIYNPGDLEEAIGRQQGRKVDLENTADVDSLIEEYLADRFVVTRADGDRAELRWVGKEVSLKTTWLYLEIPLPEGPEGATFTNTLLFEIEADQSNTMVFGRGRDRLSLRFTKDSPSQTFRRPEPDDDDGRG